MPYDVEWALAELSKPSSKVVGRPAFPSLLKVQIEQSSFRAVVIVRIAPTHPQLISAVSLAFRSSVGRVVEGKEFHFPSMKRRLDEMIVKGRDANSAETVLHFPIPEKAFHQLSPDLMTAKLKGVVQTVEVLLGKSVAELKVTRTR